MSAHCPKIKMKKPIKRILLGALFLAVAAAAYVGFDIWRLVSKGIPEAYAAWDCASLIEEYMDTHDGAWPRSWDALFSAARTLPQGGDRMLRGHTTNDLHRIKELVRVDWTSDPKKLSLVKCEGESIPFHVVTRPDGSAFPTIWSGKEPNTLIWKFLKEKASIKASEATSEPAPSAASSSTQD